MSLLDVITFRPEMQLCYVGIIQKCFEVVEEVSRSGTKSGNDSALPQASEDSDAATNTDTDDDSDTEAPAHTANVNHQAHASAMATAYASQGGWKETEPEMSDSESRSADGEEEEAGVKRVFQLRDIPFYDDKVSIFQARHGRL